MIRRCGALLPALVLIGICPVLRASVIVGTSLSLTQLQILPDPSVGTLAVEPGFNTTAFTSVFDSLGGAASDYDSELDTTASAFSATTLAYASGMATAPNLTSAAASGVLIPGAMGASAGTNVAGPYGQLYYGTFEITDQTTNTQNPQQNAVNVAIDAYLSATQNLFTDQFGLEAFSEVTFNLGVYDPNFNQVTSLFLDNPLTISQNSSLSQSSTQVLSSGTLPMFTNTDYYLFAETDAESLGVNTTPEPSYSVLFAALLWLIVFRGKFSNGPGARRAT
jgi:hypothetical protein